ncbi:MAG TPA: glycosyltransferase [Burkholderiaceae bacterium]|nr:glycosyltransferase [Burkholderiaceae bacterium]
MHIEVLYVVYKPDVKDLHESLRAVHDEVMAGVPARVRVWHNDTGPDNNPYVADVYRQMWDRGLPLTVEGTHVNMGFGPGINAMLTSTESGYVLLMNQDAIPEPGSLCELWSTASGDASNVAAWEMRQIPYEHPKAYDPVTLDVDWVSGAAVLLKTEALRNVGGFEPRIFMYGEDVELSWRLRCAGWRLRYLARAAVVHRTYSKADEVKPIQALEGIYANLALRARYSGHRRIASGLMMALGEMVIPQPFPGRRAGIAKAIAKFLRNYRYFWNSHQAAIGFEPRFDGWGFELRREGAFHVFKSRREQISEKPLVSVLIRTHKRGAFLRQALRTVANQTWRPIEAVVVEDGSHEGEAVCKEFEDVIPVRYHRVYPGRGRSVAGNLALSLAKGEWMCFLDDDDVLFADHIEVLVVAAQAECVAGAYGLSWRTHTEIVDRDSAVYRELLMETAPDEAFSRVSMWHHNFIPIQALVFHRRLFDKHGGFAEDMDQLEDWNLWTRYTIDESFVQVRKVTSKYRVPSEVEVSIERQQKLDEAYEAAVDRQRAMSFTANPVYVRELAQTYAQQNAVVHIGKDEVKTWLTSRPMLRRLFALRALMFRWRARR